MKRLFSILLSVIFIYSTGLIRRRRHVAVQHAPKDKVKAKYGFELTQDGSITCGCRRCGSTMAARARSFRRMADLHQSSRGRGVHPSALDRGQDYIKTGFYAKTQAEEAKCPNLELNQLVGIEDVRPR